MAKSTLIFDKSVLEDLYLVQEKILMKLLIFLNAIIRLSVKI